MPVTQLVENILQNLTAGLSRRDLRADVCRSALIFGVMRVINSLKAVS